MIARQSMEFLAHGGDLWFGANRKELGIKQADSVMDLIELTGFQPKRVLEVGCSNGWRLKRLRDKYSCEVRGIEPSQKAVDESIGLLGEGIVTQGICQMLPWEDNSFDTVILGYCLSFIDPNDIFTCMSETNRVLIEGGMLIIYDRIYARPVKIEYARDEIGNTLNFYFMDYVKLWLGHPGYKAHLEQYRTIEAAVTILRKDMSNAFMAGEALAK